MSRMLVMAERQIGEAERGAYLRSVSDRGVIAAQSGANFWAFERVTENGHFLEFTEAATAEAMLPATPDATSLPLWREVKEV